MTYKWLCALLEAYQLGNVLVYGSKWLARCTLQLVKLWVGLCYKYSVFPISRNIEDFDGMATICPHGNRWGRRQTFCLSRYQNRTSEIPGVLESSVRGTSLRIPTLQMALIRCNPNSPFKYWYRRRTRYSCTVTSEHSLTMQMQKF